MKLLPSLAVHYATMHHVTSLYAKHIHMVHAHLAVTCHLHFWQNDQGLLRATAVTRGMDTKMKVSTESQPCQDSNSRPFDHESGAQTTELSPLPNNLCIYPGV